MEFKIKPKAPKRSHRILVIGPPGNLNFIRLHIFKFQKLKKKRLWKVHFIKIAI